MHHHSTGALHLAPPTMDAITEAVQSVLSSPVFKDHGMLVFVVAVVALYFLCIAAEPTERGAAPGANGAAPLPPREVAVAKDTRPEGKALTRRAMLLEERLARPRSVTLGLTGVRGSAAAAFPAPCAHNGHFAVGAAPRWRRCAPCGGRGRSCRPRRLGLLHEPVSALSRSCVGLTALPWPSLCALTAGRLLAATWWCGAVRQLTPRPRSRR